ncbi:MAG: FtsW/RodA/SpoVE family cell cycle protein [Anaerolineales bacterium]
MMQREFWRQFDYWLFGSVVILCIFGIAMIRSAIAGNQVLAELVTRQSIYVGLGLVVVLVTAIIDYHYWASISRVMYAGTIAFLVIVFIVGEVQFGSARRLDTGLFFIQPSEIAKIVLVLVLADFFAKRQEQTHNLSWLFRSFLTTMGIVVWILLQPNLSTSIVMMVLWFSLLWISGLPLKHLLVFAVIALVFVVILGGLVISGVKLPFIADYQIARVVNFLFPDPNARHGDTYNVEQALITIGSGGWFGQGYGHSPQVQLRFLKVRHTDFIYAAMASEFGFVGTTIVTGLLIFVILRCLRAARIAADPFGSLIAYGIATVLFFQTAVNIGVNLNLIPVTGLTLPFVSYGGSSLLSLVLGIGLVESVVARHKLYEA